MWLPKWQLLTVGRVLWTRFTYLKVIQLWTKSDYSGFMLKACFVGATWQASGTIRHAKIFSLPSLKGLSRMAFFVHFFSYKKCNWFGLEKKSLHNSLSCVLSSFENAGGSQIMSVKFLAFIPPTPPNLTKKCTGRSLKLEMLLFFSCKRKEEENNTKDKNVTEVKNQPTECIFFGRLFLLPSLQHFGLDFPSSSYFQV